MAQGSRWDELRDALFNAYINSIPLIIINVAWFVLTLPVITAIPALGGLFYATNHMAHQRAASWQTFLEGIRSCFWLSLRWGLMNLVMFGLLGLSIWFYAQVKESWAAVVRPLVVSMLILWMLLQMYTFPLLLEQEDQRLVTALRNSAVIWVKRPLFSLMQAAILAVMFVVSTYWMGPAWIFITGSLGAYLANRAVIDSIAQITGKPRSD